ncbi:alanine--tRNA ligase [Terrilactibacillus sp. BCM23-1]|uniref:Alanine--tRNA ligase n=1 Tax=Terrilactibacillus tamarindi TaxID=2599694 RepID=A0A6N8CTB4_9BACI|nr:alanine--tRNA ligase [Terrilactibacillus tamarindi]MTT32457.1 alanine--tRNA ligase [Terrilactibacillus tamarindi]
MKHFSSTEIRQMYLDFFKQKGHKVEPSASLIPVNDPTLLWINSGVATLKKYFDGTVIPENPRIVNAQKAIRTNDIENVGKTARHHTFFEMLGNFSIGDYFREEAITWAWELLTSDQWFSMPKDKLFVTVYPEDKDSYNCWIKLGVSPDHIVLLEDNFWEIGEGPSGPDTEIFFDRGPAYDPENLGLKLLQEDIENDRYIEIWNIVLSQFNAIPSLSRSEYPELPKKNIDTGMGFERMVCVLQEADTNYDSDLFMPIIHEVERLSKKKYRAGNKADDMAFKVIADHIRTVTFAISDGALPSNEGRGYVLRRLLRRAVRYALQLNIKDPFMYKLVAIVGRIMNSFYPEVEKNTEFIQKVVRTEEERFHETLTEGIAILEGMIDTAKANNETKLSGKDIFRLYDTFGFPVELTEEYAEEKGLEVDHEGFENEMAQQRSRAREARQDQGSMHVQNELLGSINVPSQFVGYDHLTASSTLNVLIQGDQKVDSAKQGEEVLAFFDQTPFYAESGGQVADQGQFVNDSAILEVKSVHKAPNGQNMHMVIVKQGSVHTGDVFKAVVDRKKRMNTEKNHTSTHLLHQALKDTLGTHVNQAGSLVTPDRLRFDFSHFGQITEEELQTIERIVNEKIWDQLQVNISEKPIDEAKAMGAMALFGEKYGDIVRVVQVGDYSLELCGGCHVRNTAFIGQFKIVSESGIGAGTRRIEAVTGQAAYEFVNKEIHTLDEGAELLKTNREHVPDKITLLQKQVKELEKENNALSAKISQSQAGDLIHSVTEQDGIPYIAKKVSVSDMNQLRAMVDQLKNKLQSGIILLAASNEGKVSLVCGVSKDLIDKGFHAGKIIKEAASRCGGGGGGRPDMAQAGGKNPDKIQEALNSVSEFIKDAAKIK